MALRRCCVFSMTAAGAGDDVVVWEHDGLVFTCVSDAPRDVYAVVLGAIARSEYLGHSPNIAPSSSPCRRFFLSASRARQ